MGADPAARPEGQRDDDRHDKLLILLDIGGQYCTPNNTQAPGQVSSQSLVRYETNDYSVPVAYGRRDVWVRGYVERVVVRTVAS